MANTVFGGGVLSGSTDGRGIKIAATATAGTLIHTAQADTTLVDMIRLYAQNNDTVDRLLTIEWGGVSSPDDLIQVTIPFKSGLFLVVPYLPLRNGLVVRGFAAATNVISVFGGILRASA